MENGGSAVKMYTNTPQALRLIFLTKKLSYYLSTGSQVGIFFIFFLGLHMQKYILLLISRRWFIDEHKLVEQHYVSFIFF